MDSSMFALLWPGCCEDLPQEALVASSSQASFLWGGGDRKVVNEEAALLHSFWFLFFFWSKYLTKEKWQGYLGPGDSPPPPRLPAPPPPQHFMEDREETEALGRLEPCAVWHPDNRVVNWAYGLQSSVGLSKNHCLSNLERQKPSQRDCVCCWPFKSNKPALAKDFDSWHLWLLAPYAFFSVKFIENMVKVLSQVMGLGAL